MRLMVYLAGQAILLAITDSAIVGVRFNLVCRLQRNRRLRKDHRLWVHAFLMERDRWSQDDLLRQRERRNRDNNPRMSFSMYSGDVSDGFADNYLEVYLDIVHNCVKHHRVDSKTKTIEVGDFRVSNSEPSLVDLGTIYLP
ncbi:unnamed protein product [Cylicocyclus nassatus]|uniref:Uncharacterized protein n=1 Tax=Cylicocyclus nassatus TaxID=53992 RepID=A0AA36H4Y1_CYLNA|nr:unnamed protein product [Cylicocyclus nassatus]